MIETAARIGHRGSRSNDRAERPAHRVVDLGRVWLIDGVPPSTNSLLIVVVQRSLAYTRLRP